MREENLTPGKVWTRKRFILMGSLRRVINILHNISDHDDIIDNSVSNPHDLDIIKRLLLNMYEGIEKNNKYKER